VRLNKYLVETNNPERDGAGQVYCAENPEEAVELYYEGENLRRITDRIFTVTDIDTDEIGAYKMSFSKIGVPISVSKI
jgi:hypothetical protein